MCCARREMPIPYAAAIDDMSVMQMCARKKAKIRVPVTLLALALGLSGWAGPCNTAWAKESDCSGFLLRVFTLKDPLRSLKELWARLRLSAEFKELDYSKVMLAKKAYMTQLESSTAKVVPAPKTFEERLALIEILSARIGLTAINSQELITGLNDVEKRTLDLLLRKYGEAFQEGFHSESLSRFVTKLYLLKHGSLYALEPWVKSGRAAYLRSVIENLLMERIAFEGFEAGLKESGLMRDATMMERLQGLWHSEDLLLLVNIAFNAYLISQGVYAVVPPGSNIRRFVSLSKKTMEATMKNGFDAEWERAILPELLKSYGGRITADTLYVKARGAWLFVLGAMVPFAIYAAWSDYEQEWDKMFDRLMGSVKEQSKNLTLKTSNTPSAKDQLWDSWVENYKATHGGSPPVPSSEDYKKARYVIYGE